MKRAYFVCVGNAGRSQLAQALYERRGGEARSAGSHPEERLHPTVVTALEEIGVEVGDRAPKPVREEDVGWADVVVTMGCGDACPVFPGKVYIDWDLPDPVSMSLDEVRELRRRIKVLVDEL